MSIEKLFFAIFIIEAPFEKLRNFCEIKDIYDIDGIRKTPRGLYFEK